MPLKELDMNNANPIEQPDIPSAWMICKGIGHPSEVWMHRQATGMDQLRLHVMAKRHLNEDAYPMLPESMTLIPEFSSVQRSKFIRNSILALNILRNHRLGGFSGSPAEAKWWCEQIERNRPSVVLCQYGPVGLHIYPLLKAHGIPTVVHFHGSDISTALRNPIYRIRLKSMLPALAGCAVVAKYQRDALLGLGAREEQIRIIPCGVPLQDSPHSDSVSNQPCRFLAVGRLVEKKAPDLTIRAFAQCATEVPAASLTFIGDGELLEGCQQLARSLGVDNRITFLGIQPYQRVREELLQTGAFVQHSVTSKAGDMEGWPVGIAEAACCGIPVVSTYHASIPEQVEHKQSGLLCEEGDWKTMGNHMTQLARDPELRKKMGTAAREKISHFDTTNQIGQLQALLLDAAQQARNT